jgi:hypothetical protein
MNLSRLKMAELTSGLGALVLGVGLGVFFAERLASLAIPSLIIGAISHAWGMFDKSRIEKAANQPSLCWETALYWLCWSLLAGMAIFLIYRAAI